MGQEGKGNSSKLPQIVAALSGKSDVSQVNPSNPSGQAQLLKRVLFYMYIGHSNTQKNIFTNIKTYTIVFNRKMHI
jgi:hypothetical protein